ncbi:enoyl-CoA hydratase-related protein [Mycobacterium syngnathidarum]
MPDVTAERHGAVLLIRFNRPEQHNSVGGTMLRDFLAGLREASEDDGIHVIVTTGAGSTYCVGADVTHLAQARDYAPYELLTGDIQTPDGTILGGETGLPRLSHAGRVTDRHGIAGRLAEKIWSIEKPTIAAINGPAAGGGLAIALLHDFRIAADNAKLATAFLKLGVGPELAISYLLPRIVGWPAATDLLLRGKTVAADEAMRLGLVNDVAPPDRVLEEAMGLAEELAALPNIAQQLTKRALRRAMTDTIAEQLEHEYQTQLALFSLPDHEKGVHTLQTRLGLHR